MSGTSIKEAIQKLYSAAESERETSARNLERYKNALEKIIQLENAKEMRSPLVSGCPSHLMTEDGYEPIHPMVKEGLRIAVKIAKEALKEA